MDPVASGLTIISAIRKAVTTAKKLYDAPRELEELQVEVETFKSVLNDVTSIPASRATLRGELNY